MSPSAFVVMLVMTFAQSPQGQTPPVPATPSPQQPAGAIPSDANVPDGLQVQVMLDRAGFSPGVIDGNAGRNTRKALDAYRKQNAENGSPAVEAVVKYQITPEDAAGPFTADIPTDMVEQSKLPALGYRSIVELLAERFHSTPALLQRLNPGAKFAAGEEITVPNVEPLALAAATPPPPEAAKKPQGAGTAPKPEGTSGKTVAAELAARPDVVVTVSKETSALTVTDASGRMILYAPVTTGSERDPLPIGEWKVNGIQLNPPFRYNPDLFWDADPSHTKATIPPGPNNPVGLVWIDISKEHYGIHGTPEPATIGRTESHGCVRLTNWDAIKLAGLVKPGTKVVFTR